MASPRSPQRSQRLWKLSRNVWLRLDHGPSAGIAAHFTVSRQESELSLSATFWRWSVDLSGFAPRLAEFLAGDAEERRSGVTLRGFTNHGDAPLLLASLWYSEFAADTPDAGIWPGIDFGLSLEPILGALLGPFRRLPGGNAGSQVCDHQIGNRVAELEVLWLEEVWGRPRSPFPPLRQWCLHIHPLGRRWSDDDRQRLTMERLCVGAPLDLDAALAQYDAWLETRGARR